MGSEARARLGLAALLGITLISFSMLFKQGDYPGPILIGMVVAAGIVILMRRLGAGIPLTLVVSAGALYWYLSIVFQAPHTFYGLPTLATGRGLADSLQFAYTKSYIDFAPVPIRPGYVIATIGIMWVATTIGEIATFRLRRPLLASFLPVTLFTFLLIVGTGAGAQFYVAVFIAALLVYWAFESAHRLRSWGRWMSTWSHVRADAPTSIATGIARKMGVSCVAAAIVAPLFLPLLGHGGISWRNSVGAGPNGGGGGQAVGGNVDLLASITPEKIRQSTETLFTVDADSETYWRLASLSRFDGKTWLQGNASRTTVGDDGNVETTLDPPGAAKTLTQTIHIEGLEGSHLPAAVEPINVQFDKLDDLRVDRDSGDLEITPELRSGMTYTVSSAVTEVDYDRLRTADLGAPGPAYQTEPPGVTNRVEALRNEWTAGADTPFDKLVAIQDHLRAYTYTLDVQPGTSAADLADFLLNTQEGYCQQFATAFAVLSRSMGYPTRVSIGFLPGEQSPTDPTHFEVTGLHTHAWPEVYFEKFGWVRFEPTPRAIAPQPAWTVDLRGTGGPGGGPGGNGGAQGGHKFADGTLANPFQRGGRADDPGTTEPAPRDTSPAWRPAFTRLMLVVFALGLLWALVVPGLKILRVRKRYSRAESPRDVVAAAFAEFEDEAAELATRRHPAESAAAFVERVASLGVVSRSAAARLGRLYDAAEYSVADVPANHGDEARRIAGQLKASMWRAASIARKTARLFSARELLAARAGRGTLRRRLRTASATTGLTGRV